jgi:hypothetical protein
MRIVTDKEIREQYKKNIRPVLLKLVEQSFKKYVKNHTLYEIDTEWEKFKKILVRNL